MPGISREWVFIVGQNAARVALTLLLFLALRWVCVRALQTLMRPLLSRAEREGATHLARLRTLQGLAGSSITYTLLFLTLVTVLGVLGVNVTAIVTGAGVAGLALSFGAQRLVRDILTGFFFLLEDQFRVGEVVTLIGGPGLPQLTGAVLEMGLRVTRVQELNGRLVTIGNGDVAAVVNHSRGPISATVDVGVPPELPPGRIEELVGRLELPEALFTGPASMEGVTALEGSRMVVRIAAPSAPGRAPEAELALRQELGRALREAEVEIR
jgi:small-conductance mechanosensitive channel